jgi:GntR family transcriptional regulator / MocR family aminotransferase
MADSWAISGVDLHLDVSGPRRRAGLEEALRTAIRSGRLPSGGRLPSSRALAADLGLARNTVAEAYGQLVAEGWLVARQGSGTRVADRAPAAAAAGSRSAPEPAPPRHDLRPGWPDVSGFPRSAWLAATRRALDAAPFGALGYGDPRGRPELRQALAGYLARARGVDAAADRIVVCAGFTQGLALLAHVLREGGTRTLALEAYGHPLHRRVVAAAGLQTHGLAVDRHGAATDALGAAGAALLTPAHQFPLGVALAPARRGEAVRWAKRTGGVLIEDDYDGEFRYDRQPVGAMQALAPEHVVYAGSASKTLAPGLRLGWLVLPSHLVGAVAAAKETRDGEHSVIDQLALAELLARGAYDRHVRRARLAYRRRRDRLVAALAGQAPGVRVGGIAAGLHARVTLPPGSDEHALVEHAAAAHGLALEGLSAYHRAGPPQDPALVVGYTRPAAHAYTGALARLTAVLAQAGAGAFSAASSVAPTAPPRSPSEASRMAGGR